MDEKRKRILSLLLEEEEEDDDLVLFSILDIRREEVLNMISPLLEKQPNSFVQDPISGYEKFALTLRYLAAGESFRSLAFACRISHNHISLIVKEVLAAICKKLLTIYLPVPTTQSMRAVAEDFNEIWNFPNCCETIDGKHCRIICPSNTDVGSYGKEGDSGIFKKSKLYEFLSSEDAFQRKHPCQILIQFCHMLL
ncbi:uncharacterized protein LOC126750259 [Anthonomus grandis grandis]|uniref:uncharacterized protein LOC126750259 n=1 Tax=Anthonomus grandis grandis TaxID=2921223 RepID=UPI002165C673|nr:uncharacterized protein LOC126750259 [Anthonomus grandis grandis]